MKAGTVRLRGRRLLPVGGDDEVTLVGGAVGRVQAEENKDEKRGELRPESKLHPEIWKSMKQ